MCWNDVVTKQNPFYVKSFNLQELRIKAPDHLLCSAPHRLIRLMKIAVKNIFTFMKSIIIKADVFDADITDRRVIEKDFHLNVSNLLPPQLIITSNILHLSCSLSNGQ